MSASRRMGYGGRGDVANKAYERALETSKLKLSKDELEDIQQPTSIDELMGTIRQVVSKHESGDQRRLVRFISKQNSIATSLDRFSGLLEGACKSTPMGGELLWSSIKFAFNVADDVHDTFETLLNCFTQMADQMALFDSLANTFANKQMVMDSVEAVYETVIVFWTKAMKLYRRKAFAVIGKFVLSAQLKSHYKDLESEFKRQGKLLMASAQVQYYADDKRSKESFTEHITDEQDERFLRWLRARPTHQEDFEKAAKKRYKDTCQWVLEKKEYQTWEAARSGSFLAVYGKAGSGKTIISSFLVQRHVKTPAEKATRPAIGLFFYFKLDDDQKNSREWAARSLLYQLYQYFRAKGRGDYFRQEMDRRQLGLDPGMNSYEVLWGTIKSIITAEEADTVLILDAMDECKDSKVFAKDLQQLTTQAPFKVLVTSRQEGEHIKHFARLEDQDCIALIRIETEDVKKDIASFVAYKVGHRLATVKDDEALKSQIIDVLSTRHNGMFLWVYLTLQELKRAELASDIKDILYNLPEGLDGTYVNILNRLYSRLARRERAFAQRVLRWIVGSTRPLTILEIKEAMSVENARNAIASPGSDGLGRPNNSRTDSSLLYSGDIIVHVCGSLVSVSTADSHDGSPVLNLIHLSARTFLQQDPEALQVSDLRDHMSDKHLEYASTFLVNPIAAEASISETCLDYLLLQALRTLPKALHSVTISEERTKGVKDLRESYPLLNYASLYWLEYFLDAVHLFGPTEGVKKIIKQAELFIQKKSSVFWLEELLRNAGPEVTWETMRRLLAVSEIELPPKLVRWLKTVIELLEQFGKDTLFRDPQLVHKLVPLDLENSDPKTRCENGTQEIVDLQSRQKRQGLQRVGESFDLSFDKDAKRWIKKVGGDNGWLFHIPHMSEFITLSAQKLGVGSLRPYRDLEERNPDRQWFVRSAAIDDNKSHIAAVFTNADVGYATVVIWRLDLSVSKATDTTWAERICLQRVSPERLKLFKSPKGGGTSSGRAGLLSFVGDGSLMTPCGSFHLYNEEFTVDRSPQTIFEPNQELGSTCFGRKRVSRVNNNTEIEVLDLSGRSLLKTDIPSYVDKTSRVDFHAISKSGMRLFASHRDPLNNSHETLYFLFDTETGNKRYLLVPDGLNEIYFPAFTDDESKLVSFYKLDGVLHFVVWDLGDTRSLSKEDCMATRIFKLVDQQRKPCFTIENEYGTDQVIIACSDGRFIERQIDVEWSSAEEEDFKASNLTSSSRSKVAKRFSSDGKNYVFAILCVDGEENATLKIENWRLYGAPNLVENQVISIPQSDKFVCTFSASGDYLIVNTTIFRLEDGKISPMTLSPELFGLLEGSHKCDIGLGEDPIMVSIAPQASILELHKIVRTSSTLGVVSLAAQDLRCILFDFNVSFNYAETAFSVSLSGLDQGTFDCLNMTLFVAINEDQPKFTHVSNIYLENHLVSYCGSYLVPTREGSGRDYWPIEWPELHDIEIPPESRRTQTRKRPTTLREYEVYVSGLDMYRIRGESDSGILYLDHKLVTDPPGTFRYRTLCAIPDIHRDVSGVYFELHWPDDHSDTEKSDSSEDELKLCILSHDKSLELIRTGVTCQSVFDEKEWTKERNIKRRATNLVDIL